MEKSAKFSYPLPPNEFFFFLLLFLEKVPVEPSQGVVTVTL